MASSAQTRMLGLLQSELVAVAVDLSERAGTREYCFPVRDARQILESLLGARQVILGGDLWVREGDEYSSAGEGWYVDSVDQESFHDRAQRIRTAAERFFDLYENSDDQCVTFVVKS
jgi:hypothetical protein